VSGEYYVLGYERIVEDEHVIDVMLEKRDGKYELILPTEPKEKVRSSDLVFIGVQNFKEKGYENEKSAVKTYRIKSDDRPYILLTLSDTRKNVVFRCVKGSSNGIIARVVITPIVLGYKESDKVPNVFYRSDGRMELETEEYRKQFIKDVKVIKATYLDGREFTEVEEINEQVKNGLNRDIVKEAGDAEIGLAVVTETKKLKGMR